VTAKDPKNADQIAAVQMHLKHIVGMFREGDFSIPHFVHDTNPPGAATMKRLRSSIRYTSETMDNGGRIRSKRTHRRRLQRFTTFCGFRSRIMERATR
jgi:hypothetical protein